jgi:alpha-beta hydrolase superfamily lysophospholipase
MTSKTVVLIHGMFMTPLCWEQWLTHLQAKGYICIAPAWPGRDKPVESLRANHPDPQLGKLTLKNVVEHFTNTIRGLDEKPILIGHSMGGLVAQLLLQQGLGAAGVAIDSAPPAGVFTTKWSFLKANWPMINPFISKSTPRMMPFDAFQYAFVNTLPLEEQKAAYDRYVVPESRGVPRDSLTSTARIDFKKGHPPLLLIAGSEDHIIPASLNKTNYSKYLATSQTSASITDFKEFEGRVHFIIGQSNWQEVADYILAWLNEKGV